MSWRGHLLGLLYVVVGGVLGTALMIALLIYAAVPVRTAADAAVEQARAAVETASAIRDRWWRPDD